MKRYPSWKYRIFRLRYVDHYGDDVHQWGVSWDRDGFRSDLSTPGVKQFAIMFGPRLIVFDLKWWWK